MSTHDRTRRVAHGVAVAMLWGHAVLLLITLPVVVFLTLMTGWEGGDLTFKHRLAEWGMTSVYGQLACAVALGAAAVVVQRRSPGRRAMLATESGLLVCLGGGWVWVWQREMLTSASVVGVWLVFTTPGLVAAGLVALTTRTPPGAPQAVEAPPA